MNWGDTLCGVEVTPESWAGGVVELAYTRIEGNSWIITAEGYKPNCECSTCRDTEQGRPIFPPRGWAGKTDAELWAEVFGMWEGEIACISTRKGAISLCVDSDGNLDIDVSGGATRCWASRPDELPALILALQNAQVLAARLSSAAKDAQ